MENNKLKNLGSKIKLSISEKAFHRQEILNFIENEKIIQSPYLEKMPNLYFGIFLRKHFVLTSLIIFSFLSTGLVVNADHAVPNDYLYQMKIKIIEPAKIMLAPTVEKKNTLRVKFVDEALRDFSHVSQKEEIKKSDKTALIDSVSLNIKDLNKEISSLSEENNNSNSLKTANDLKSVLTAHVEVLNKISELNPEENETKLLSSKVNESIIEIEEKINTINKTIADTENYIGIDQMIKNKKELINNSLREIELSNSTGADPINYPDFDKKLLEINTLLKEADKKLTEEDKEEALILYNNINQKLIEFKLLIESEQIINNKIIDKKPKINVEEKIDIPTVDPKIIQ